MATKFRQLRSVSEILKSAEIENVLVEIGERVLAAAQSDPNPAYVDSLRMQVFESSSRVSVQVGAAPGIGEAVEAARGTLARALGGFGGRAGDDPTAKRSYTTRSGKRIMATDAQIANWTKGRG